MGNTGEDAVGFAADMAKMAADPTTQRWWLVCMPCQKPLDNRAVGEWWATMKEVFHLDWHCGTASTLPVTRPFDGSRDGDMLAIAEFFCPHPSPLPSSGRGGNGFRRGPDSEAPEYSQRGRRENRGFFRTKFSPRAFNH
jgi:hypothetical protein